MGATIPADGRKAFDAVLREIIDVSLARNFYSNSTAVSSRSPSLRIWTATILETSYIFFMQGALSLETKGKYHIITIVDPPPRPFLCPFPHKGTVYDYRFIKEVNMSLLKLLKRLERAAKLTLSVYNLGHGEMGVVDRRNQRCSSNSEGKSCYRYCTCA